MLMDDERGGIYLDLFWGLEFFLGDGGGGILNFCLFFFWGFTFFFGIIWGEIHITIN